MVGMTIKKVLCVVGVKGYSRSHFYFATIGDPEYNSIYVDIANTSNLVKEWNGKGDYQITSPDSVLTYPYCICLKILSIYRANGWID